MTRKQTMMLGGVPVSVMVSAYNFVAPKQGMEGIAL